MERKIKLLVVGDGGVGKTTWINSLNSQVFEERYIPTQGVSVSNFSYFYENKNFEFALWDLAGNPVNGGLRDGYFIGGDAGIIMYDASSFLTRSAASLWKRDLIRSLGNVPWVLVKNKVDLSDEEINADQEVVQVSNKNRVNVFEPIIRICRIFNQRESLQNNDDVRKDLKIF